MNSRILLYCLIVCVVLISGCIRDEEPSFESPEYFEMVRQVSNPSEIRNLAANLVSKTSKSDRASIIKTVYNYTALNLNYVPDPNMGDRVFSPRDVIMSRGGDCDDFAVLIASMLEAVGQDAVVVAYRTRPAGGHMIAGVRVKNPSEISAISGGRKAYGFYYEGKLYMVLDGVTKSYPGDGFGFDEITSKHWDWVDWHKIIDVGEKTPPLKETNQTKINIILPAKTTTTVPKKRTTTSTPKTTIPKTVPTTSIPTTTSKPTTTTSQAKFVCNPPYIQVGSGCCLDKNKNGICDKEDSCPLSCDDEDYCTRDYCNKNTNFECVHERDERDICCEIEPKIIPGSAAVRYLYEGDLFKEYLCYTNLSIKYQDPSFCTRIRSESLGYNMERYCFRRLANEIYDESYPDICDLLEDNSYKEKCYKDVIFPHQMSGNSAYCYKIKKSIEMQKYCYEKTG